jgi:ABC-type branched-subunit amino acid transport system ATPase component
MWMPRLVLIDELSSGLKLTLAASIFRGAAPTQRRGPCHHPDGRTERTTHLGISDRGCALELGRHIFEGTKAEMLASVAVRRSLLGTNERVPDSAMSERPL